jgi:DNA-binding transcriptional MerR regulator
MFKIGEFSKIAQVPASLLRYYDEIGLLKPAHNDPSSGYRFYSATQLTRLNQIIALKDLGLTLEQITRVLTHTLPTEEIRGMLTLKKSQLEQTLREEVARLNSVETRLVQLERQGRFQDYDVVLKTIPAQRWLSWREVYPTRPDGLAVMWQLLRELPERAGSRSLGPFTIVFHFDALEYENVDIEMGYPLLSGTSDALTLPGGRTVTVNDLPSVEVASVVRHGWVDLNVSCYASLGEWIEAHDYQFAGPGREVSLEPPVPGREREAVAELQIPIIKRSKPLLSFT